MQKKRKERKVKGRISLYVAFHSSPTREIKWIDFMTRAIHPRKIHLDKTAHENTNGSVSNINFWGLRLSLVRLLGKMIKESCFFFFFNVLELHNL